MEIEKRMAGEYEITQSILIGDREVVFGINDNNPERPYFCAFYERNELLGKYDECMVSDDYAELVTLFAKRIEMQCQKLKEAQMTEQEKLQAKLAEYEQQLQQKEREAAEARLKAQKVQALEKAGLPTAWADRIFGTEDKEIENDIKELQKLLGMSPTKVGSGTNPAAAKNSPDFVSIPSPSSFNILLQEYSSIHY